MCTPLTEAELTSLATDRSQWTINGDLMTRTFTLADFSEAMGFVIRVSLAAEQLDHHPDIDIRWNRVTLTLTTHSARALTGLDRELASIADGFVDT